MILSYLRLNRSVSIRSFSSGTPLRENARASPNNFSQRQSHLNEKSKSVQSLSNSKKKKLENAPITRQHAAHLLSKLTGHEVDMHTLGPLSNDDIKYFKVADKRTMCALLGTTPNQLLDSVIVDRTVRSFLSRGQLEKALMTARLAKSKGSVAMNRIVEYVLAEGKVNDALQIHSSRKKWGVLPNEQSITILFDGCSNIRNPMGGSGLTVKQVEKIQKILVELKNAYKFKLNLTHINSGFTALLNCKDQTMAFKTWDDWNAKKIFPGNTPNTKTYTILLQGLAHGPGDIWVLMQAEPILEKIRKLPDRLQDRKLYEAYVFAYIRCSRLDFIQRGLEAAHAFFQLETKPTIKAPSSNIKNIRNKNIKTVDEEIKFKPLAPLKDKWIPTASLIDILIKVYIQLNEHKEALKVFKEFEENHPAKLDLSLLHRYMIILRETSKSTSGKDSVEFYKLLAEERYVSRIRPSSKTRYMVFNAIYSQSLTTLNDMGSHAIGKESDAIFDLAENFLNYIKKDVGPYEMTGYLKAIRRLRLRKSQRDLVLKRIEHSKKHFDEELKTTKNKTSMRENIKSILDAEKDILSKQEKKSALEKLDKLEKEKKSEERENNLKHNIE